MIANILQSDANAATIIGFAILAIGAILGPLLGGRRTTRIMNSANGASRKAGLDTDRYRDYNLYDLCLQSLVNSEKAKEEAVAAAALSSLNKVQIDKVIKHLGIEE